MSNKRCNRFHYVHEPLADGSPYSRLLGRVTCATGHFVATPRLPRKIDIKHADYVQGVTLCRYTAVVPETVLDLQFLALTKSGAAPLCFLSHLTRKLLLVDVMRR
jgi:hypothetical protein